MENWSLDLRETDPAGFRIKMTSRAKDCELIPKVSNAGEIYSLNNNQQVQVMHNGLLIEKDCYFGPWMTEIIANLRGHHEPQEEYVFYKLLEKLNLEQNSEQAVILELGSFWAYYSMWFLKEVKGSRAILLEPDRRRLEIGKKNFKLNQISGTFIEGAIGKNPGKKSNFLLEENNQIVKVKEYNLSLILSEHELENVTILMCDIQGAESFLFTNEISLLKSGKIRFLMISTHHHSISLNPALHQDLLSYFQSLGAHVICEHSVLESFSGDGLIAISFAEEDKNFRINVSRNRSVESLFKPLEIELRELVQSRRPTNLSIRQLVLEIQNSINNPVKVVLKEFSEQLIKFKHFLQSLILRNRV
jgi:FkbM family methyltransferase